MSAATHCPYCALQCAMTVDTDGAVPTVAPRQFPTNLGGLCRKGWSSTDLLTYPQRLRSPLMRASKDAPLEEVSWDVAMTRIATGIEQTQSSHGRDAVGVFGGGGLTNEKAYLLGKFARVVLGTRCIDYNGRWCMSSAAAGSTKALGVDRGMPFPLSDLAGADLILMVGANVAETMPPFMQHVLRMLDDGGELLVVDPRRTATAEAATLHLQPLPGTDLALANGLLHLLIEDGAIDNAYLTARTSGFEAIRGIAAGYWPERVERLTGVPVPTLRKAATLLAQADKAFILTARGAEQHINGSDTVMAFINLALALGLPGTEGSGYGTITGQGNGQGGREHGQKADQLPGYRKLDDPVARAHVAEVWGVDPDSLPVPGPSAYELLETMGTEGGVRSLLLLGSNPVVSAPRSTHITERLHALDLLVVCDFVLSESAAIADVVLPTAQWAEEEGTLTNLEGRVIIRQRALAPPPGVRTDLEVISELASRLGATHGFPSEPREVFEELRLATAGAPADYSGITYERLIDTEGVFWPCPSEEHPGTPRMFLESFATADGRAKCHPVEFWHTAESTDEEYPVYLTTGRVLAHYQSGAQTRRIKELDDASPRAFVELHPALASSLGIVDGVEVRIVTRRGEALAFARVTAAIRPDTIFAPFHWAGTSTINATTNPALDPISRMPEFKLSAARLELVA